MKKVKLLLSSFYKVFFTYKAGFRYLYFRYYVAPKIYRCTYELKVTDNNLSIHMLTSHADLLIALWSLASYFTAGNPVGSLTIHDDGTLTEKDKKRIKSVFPKARIVSVTNFLTSHETELRAYPVLSEFRKTYKRFQSKKLIDVYYERKGDTILYLDSDLLWFKVSPEITHFVKTKSKGKSFMMSNGTERVHVNFKDGTKTKDEIAECNSGVTLFNANDYDLERLTEYIEKCDYIGAKFTDQACFGSILPNVSILPRDKYFIKGTITPDTIMRHYTGPSREKFFFYGISFIEKKILK